MSAAAGPTFFASAAEFRRWLAESGLAAFALRDPKRTGVYSFENRDVDFSPSFAKREETRERVRAIAG